jgi:predicted acyltransferase
MQAGARLDSVDALRGLTVAAMLLVNNPGDWGHVHAPLRHAAWHGCTPTDLVFPFFLFVAGVSLSLALGPRLEAGADAAALRRSLWLRALRIVLLGLLLHAAAWALNDVRAFRPMGVLQRIGLCVGVAGWLAVDTRPRTQWLVFVAILLGYAALLLLGGPLTKEGNLASRIDTALLGRLAYEFDPRTGLAHEPEGLLTTLPAIATTLLGVRAGDWLRRGQWPRIVQASLVALATGALASLVLPLNKQLWTSSYVLWSGGWALLALAAAHVAIDRWHGPALGRSFGVNAIAAYAGAWLMVVVVAALGWGGPIYQRGFAWMAPFIGPEGASLAHALAFVGLWWVVVAVMDRRGVRIRI